VERSFAGAMADRSPASDPRHERTPIGAEPPFTEIVRSTQIDPTLQQSRLMLLWRVPGMTQLADTYALDVLAHILSHGRTSRLVQDLREGRQLVNGIGASNMTYQHQGLFCLSATLKAENLAVVEQAMLEHVDRLHNELIPVADLEKVATQVANRFVFSNETPSSRANLYGYYYALMGDLEPAFTYTDRLRALTPEVIQAAARRYLAIDAYGVVTIKPE
jgi:zinc protease